MEVLVKLTLSRVWMTRRLLPIFLAATVFGQQSAGHPKNIAAIAQGANGAVVSIVMADKAGHPIAQGSGFLISRDGRVVTNYHVIRSGSSAVIKLPDGLFFPVDGVLAANKDCDVAVIKAHGNGFRVVTLGNSSKLQVGEEVVAIGSPLSLESTVSNGIVSGIRLAEEKGGNLLQITAPISPGSSGGPLFNMVGDVVGITTAHLVGGQNLNFAIPINAVKPLLASRVSRPSPFPDEAEDDMAAVGQDPIVLNNDTQFEHSGRQCNPVSEHNCWLVNRATGFADAFAANPSCHGLTLLQTSNMVKLPTAHFWYLDVSWFEVYDEAWASCSDPAATDVNYLPSGEKFCRKVRDRKLTWRMFHVVKDDKADNMKRFESNFNDLQGEEDASTFLQASVNRVCALVGGIGGHVK